MVVVLGNKMIGVGDNSGCRWVRGVAKLGRTRRGKGESDLHFMICPVLVRIFDVSVEDLAVRFDRRLEAVLGAHDLNISL